MTPTEARHTVETLLRPLQLIDEGWYVTAKRERRCCWDPSCMKPRHAIGGKVCVRVFPCGTLPENAARFPEIEHVLLSQLEGVVRTRIVTQTNPEDLRMQVIVWF